MLKFVAILALVAVTTGNPVNEKAEDITQSLDGRIIGGVDATIYEAPYQVSLQVNGRHSCGGSIIAKNWVVTAGHCYTARESFYKIHSGSSNVNSGGTTHRVQQIIRHPGYKSNSEGIPINDVALFRIYDSDAFQFSNKEKPVQLFQGNSSALVGQNALITGWGRTNSGTPTTLQKVTIPLIPYEQCNRAYKSYGGVPPGQICASASAGGKDACQGDSGGPLIVDGQLTGIVSWGIGCATRKYPGVYTDVGYYRQWIRQNSGV